MHPLTEGVTIVVTSSARLYAYGLKCGWTLAQIIDEAARREARRAAAEDRREARGEGAGKGAEGERE